MLVLVIIKFSTMQLLLMSPWVVAVTSLAILIMFSLCFNYLSNNRNRKIMVKKLPPAAAGGWPLIGHLNQLSGPDPLHITLSNLSCKYGNIFSVRLGLRYGVIVNSSEIVKECYKTHDAVFSNRPQTAAIDLMSYNFAMFAFSKYGPYWREMRRISVSRLLSNSKVEALGDVRELEIRTMMRSMHDHCSSFVTKKKVPTVDMKKVFGDLMLSLMIKTVAGDVETKMDSRERENLRRTVRDFFEMLTVFTISDVLPFLKWVDRFGRLHKAFKKTGRNFDDMLQEWLDEQKKTSTTSDDKQHGHVTFMSEMLRVAESVARQFPHYDADTINKATCLNMMVGGSDSTSATLTWALCLLLNNRQTLKRAQEELDIKVGRERLVKESDIENLVYVRAVIKETMRVQPSLPIYVRVAGEDCVVAGYDVPKGTFLFINIWKIQRDPRVWIDPLEFRPERFLTTHKEVDVQGLHCELIPFGGGRRTCPGISFAMRTAEMALASFLHGFDVETPLNEPVDMKGNFGTTNVKTTPLEVCLSPRLSPQLYA